MVDSGQRGLWAQRLAPMPSLGRCDETRLDTACELAHLLEHRAQLDHYWRLIAATRAGDFTRSTLDEIEACIAHRRAEQP